MTKAQEKKRLKLWSEFAEAETAYHRAWDIAVTYEDKLTEATKKALKKKVKKA